MQILNLPPLYFPVSLAAVEQFARHRVKQSRGSQLVAYRESLKQRTARQAGERGHRTLVAMASSLMSAPALNEPSHLGERGRVAPAFPFAKIIAPL